MGKESSHHDTTKPEALATPITPVGQLAADRTWERNDAMQAVMFCVNGGATEFSDIVSEVRARGWPFNEDDVRAAVWDLVGEGVIRFTQCWLIEKLPSVRAGSPRG